MFEYKIHLNTMPIRLTGLRWIKLKVLINHLNILMITFQLSFFLLILVNLYHDYIHVHVQNINNT